jgi:hypothetical protein
VSSVGPSGLIQTVQRSVEEVLLERDGRLVKSQLGEDVAEAVKHLVFAAKAPNVGRMRGCSNTRQITLRHRDDELTRRGQESERARSAVAGRYVRLVGFITNIASMPRARITVAALAHRPSKSNDM